MGCYDEQCAHQYAYKAVKTPRFFLSQNQKKNIYKEKHFSNDFIKRLMLNNAIVRTFIVIVRVSLIYFRCYTQRHGSFTENLKRETRILIFFSEIVTSLLNAQNTLFRLFGTSPSLHNSSAVELLSAALHDYAGSSTIIHARVEAPSARGAFISV